MTNIENTELTALFDMSIKEAREKVSNIKSCLSIARKTLLELRDRKGWLALGYASWEEFGEKEFDYSKNYLDKLASAAAVQNALGTIVPSEEIPESQLRPLKALPTDELKREIWLQVTTANEKVTAKVVQDAVNEWKLKNEALLPNQNLTDKDKETLASKWGALILESSNVIALAKKETADIKYELKKLKDKQDFLIKEAVEMALLQNKQATLSKAD